MIKNTLLLLVLFFYQILFSQVENNSYKLNSINDLLTPEVKQIIDRNVSEKQTVFLGEAVHYSGSDFLAKTEFIKYLVSEHGYKDIAFESDFFALLFSHNQQDLYHMWSKSAQCQDLFHFLAKNEVTIWGFDNRLRAPYSNENFTNKLSEFLKTKEIKLDEAFTKLANILIKNDYKSRKILSKKEVLYLEDYTSALLSEDLVKSDKKWTQILESFQSAIKLCTIKDNNSYTKRIAIRDQQMAKNLDFLIRNYPDKKFMVWLANAHMAKSNEKFMKGETMGYQFRELNPNTSYHIAFGSVRLPPRDGKEIIKAGENDNSILSLLPSLEDNYFMDTKTITNDNLELRNKLFNDMHIFNLQSKKTNFLNDFDAIVFIAYGEEIKYFE